MVFKTRLARKRESRSAPAGQASPPGPRRHNRGGDFSRYEELKAQFTASASTSAEYEAACRRAAKIAGV